MMLIVNKISLYMAQDSYDTLKSIIKIIGLQLQELPKPQN